MIGIFDSGLGGLTVTKSILKEITSASVLYFGDTARLPYGTKSKRAILKYSKENAEFLIKKGAKIIVIACNTSSALASKFLREKFKIPIFDVISPVVEEAVSATKKKKIGIIATPATIRSKVYQKKIKKLSRDKIGVYIQECPLLVPLIEEGWLKNKITKEVLKIYLPSLKNKKIDVLILGCTHYPLIKNLISKEIDKNVKIIDSAQSVAKQVKRFLEKNKKFFKTERRNHLKVFLSDEGYNFKKISKHIFNKEIKYDIDS